MIDPEDIVKAARSEKGTAFAHLGRTSGVGIDCVGLLALTARKLDIKHDDIAVYPRFAKPDKLREGLLACGLTGPFPVEEMRVGDVLFFLWGPRKKLGHVGIYCGDGRFVHAYAGAKRVSENGLEENWKSKLVEVWRFPGVSE